MSSVLVLTWKHSVNAIIGGLGMLFNLCALKSFNNIGTIQQRIMCASFNGNPCTTIISCYSPTNISDETDIITFYNEQSSLVRHIPKHNVLTIGGDMNAQIGKDENNKFCLYNSSNKNGKYQVDFSFKSRSACLNTKFQKREWKLCTLYCEAYSSFEGVSSNQNRQCKDMPKSTQK